MTGTMNRPKHLILKTSGTQQRWWCKFRHPMRGGGFVQRSTGILVSDAVAAQKFSEHLSVMLREHFSWDRKAEAEARFPDVAELYYAVALPEQHRPVDNGIEFSHSLGISATRDTMELLRKSNTIKGRVLRSDKKKDDTIAELRRDKHALELAYHREKLRADAAEAEATKLQKQIIQITGDDGSAIPSFTSLAARHVLWLRREGGLKGVPGSKVHVRQRFRHLRWWRDQLGIPCIKQIQMARVHEALDKITGLRCCLMAWFAWYWLLP